MMFYPTLFIMPQMTNSSELNEKPDVSRISLCYQALKNCLDILFQIPVTYPTTAPEIALPELDGKTAKMYR